MQALIRTYAQNIANNPGVSTGNKIALGLNPKTSSPSPITPPTTFPSLALQSPKPYGVTQCQVFLIGNPDRKF